MWHVSAVPLEWAINPNFRLSADGLLGFLLIMTWVVRSVWIELQEPEFELCHWPVWLTQGGGDIPSRFLPYKSRYDMPWWAPRRVCNLRSRLHADQPTLLHWKELAWVRLSFTRNNASFWTAKCASLISDLIRRRSKFLPIRFHVYTDSCKHVIKAWSL